VLDLSATGIYDLILFGTGIRGRSTLSGVTVSIGSSQRFPVQYAGPQGAFAGLDQVNVRLLECFPCTPPLPLSGIGEVDLELSLDGLSSNKVRIAFR